MTKGDSKVENVIIIGGGPAGLSAAIYNSRANLSPLLFAGSPPGGQLTLTTEVENFPGYESILGPELVEKMKNQAKKFGTRILDENVSAVDFSKKPFEIHTHNNKYLAKAVLIATGAKALWLGLASEERLKGRGVSACATCDGFFFRNKTVGVVGGGDTAMEEAMTLTKFASKVYIIHRRNEFRASKVMIDKVLNNPKIEAIFNSTVMDVLGENRVEGVQLKSDAKSEELKLDGLFVAIGHKPDTDLFKGKIALDDMGYIVTSDRKANETAKKIVSGLSHDIKNGNHSFDFRCPSITSVSGVFAAGDCVDHLYRQAATAAGMGVAAAIDIEKWLEK